MLVLPKGFLYQYAVKSYRIVDGDTIETELIQGFDSYTLQLCRILHVDTPEKKTLAGKAVAQVVAKWLAAAVPLFVVSAQRDKYAGRYDGIIWNSDRSMTLNDYLLAEKLARAYEGGKKPRWRAVELKKILAAANAILGVK